MFSRTQGQSPRAFNKVTQGNTITVEYVTDIINTNCTGFSYLRALNHTYAGDGGGGVFVVGTVTADPSDGGSIFVSNDGLEIKRIIKDAVYGKYFGVSPLNPDNSASFSAWMNYCNSDGAVSSKACISGQRNAKFKHSQTLVIPAKVQLCGNSGDECVFEKTADVLGIQFNGTRLEGIGSVASPLLESNTKSGILLDTPVTRFYVMDIMGGDQSAAEGNMGHGGSGVVFRQGDQGYINKVKAVANSQHGFFCDANSIESNANTFGSMDLRSNTLDGFRMDDGVSTVDANRSRSNQGGLIVCQNNGRHGAYIGTQQNALSFYCEANGGDQLLLSALSAGNIIELVEGSYTDSGTRNQITAVNDAGSYRAYTNKVILHAMEIDKNQFTGRVTESQKANDTFERVYSGSANNTTVTESHTSNRIITKNVASGTRVRNTNQIYIDPPPITHTSAGSLTASVDSPNILVDATTAATTVNITGGNAIPGAKFFIQKIDNTGNSVTVRFDNTSTRINGGEVVLAAQYESVVVLVNSISGTASALACSIYSRT